MALQEHIRKRDIACKEYQVLWYNLKHWYSICINNPKIMSAAIFEANFEKQLETLFSLADQIRGYGEIFNDFSDIIKRMVELFNTSEVISAKIDHNVINDLLVGIRVSLNPQQGLDFFPLYFGSD